MTNHERRCNRVEDCGARCTLVVHAPGTLLATTNSVKVHLREMHVMYAKQIAAAVAGLCLLWGTAQAGNEIAQERGAAAPAEAPEAVGATNDVVVIEIGPAQGGGAASAEDMAAMQMLLLQFLLMQQSEGAGNAEIIDMPRAPSGTGI